MKDASFKSTFALLDVMRGRVALQKRIEKAGSVHVLVEMLLDQPRGRDDGTSVEFAATVLSVKEYAK